MFYAPAQDKILRYAEAILANGLPPGILIIDDNWMKDYGMWDFDKHRFPEPRAMIDTLHGMGFKVMLWMCPYVSADCTMFKELHGGDLLMKGPDGAPVLRHWWNGYSAVVDYTKEEGAAWFRRQMDRLIADYGVDGFKLDAGEPILPGGRIRRSLSPGHARCACSRIAKPMPPSGSATRSSNCACAGSSAGRD
ncbi:hypothetical protein HMSSN036_59250 [Paenibacillus macerans]|nr:hypothetical protein HMSSN036_59250 [Paenibacillus macerans]